LRLVLLVVSERGVEVSFFGEEMELESFGQYGIDVPLIVEGLEIVVEPPKPLDGGLNRGVGLLDSSEVGLDDFDLESGPLGEWLGNRSVAHENLLAGGSCFRVASLIEAEAGTRLLSRLGAADPEGAWP
jgi:hypothetical protein